MNGTILISLIAAIIGIVMAIYISKKDISSDIFVGIAITLIACGLCSLLLWTSLTLVSTKEVISLKSERQYIIQVIDNADDYDNVEITEKVLEYNKQVADIKASRKTMGYFSLYWGVDLDGLDYIGG